MKRLVFLLGALACSQGMSGVDAGGDSGAMDASDASSGPSWAKVGLDGNIINVLAIDPKTPGTVFAGAAAGGATSGFYRSKDNGQSWAFTPNLPHESAHSMAIHAQQNIILASVGIDTWRSTDGGDTWNKSTGNIGAQDTLVFHPTQSVAWTVTSQQGVFRSMDGGASFSNTNAMGLPPNNTVTLGPMAFDGTKLYLAAADPVGAYTSSDNGDTWTPAGTGLPKADKDISALAIAIATPQAGVVYLETARQGLYRTTDGGTSWMKIDLGGMEAPRYGGLAIDPKAPSTILVGRDDMMTNGGTLRTIDTGKSWSPFGPEMTFVPAIAVSPADGSVFAGTGGKGVWHYK